MQSSLTRTAHRAIRRDLVFLSVVVLALGSGYGVHGAAEPEVYTHVLKSDRVDGVHSDLKTELVPVEIGPMTVRLTSPSHSLEVVEHELSLGAAGEGVDAGRLRARFQGQAHLVAELEIAGITSEIDDHIELPLQEIDVAGLVEISREEDEYRVTVIEAPSHVEIEIESDLAERLGLLCRGFAVLAMGSVDCEAVDEAMSVLRVPLPEPGEEFLMNREQLTDHERDLLDSYLRDRAN